jgi:hypothetical protein
MKLWAAKLHFKVSGVRCQVSGVRLIDYRSQRTEDRYQKTEIQSRNRSIADSKSNLKLHHPSHNLPCGLLL